MPARIRLQRHGKKGRPFYHIVAADVRAKRDGRYIEKIGTYNPNTNPATIDLEFDKAVDWLDKGAQPSDTARAILSYKGVLLRHHLLKGVRKGALTEAEADKRFEAWLKDKEQKVQVKVDSVSKSAAEAEKERITREKAIADERAKAIAAKNSEVAEREAAPEAEAVEGTPEAQAEAPAEEAPATEDSSAEAEAKEEAKAEEAPKEEAKTEEAPAEEKKEDSSAEAKAKEEPKAEEKKEEKAEAKEEKKEEEPKAEAKKEAKEEEKKEE